MSSRGRRVAAAFALATSVALRSLAAQAELVLASPIGPIEIPFPEGQPAIEARIVFELVIDTNGQVESTAVSARYPADLPDAFVDVANAALTRARFHPSIRDGIAIRSRIEYAVAFHSSASAPSEAPGGKTTAGVARISPLPAPISLPSGPAAAPPERQAGGTVPSGAPPNDAPPGEVLVRGAFRSSPRGLGDIRVERDLLRASPRQQTSEMLSAAPGFFVDHEDGEGLGNDVFLRGFDLDHGSGIEMRLGDIPINAPMHVQGQGYADANFIIPEVVRSVRVLEGPYDPRQGDAAIVGSAYFDLGVPERGYQVRASYGSFRQMRLVGIAAPEWADEDSFAAFSLRKTDGFGARRDGASGSVNAQYGIDLGPRDRLRFIATAYTGRSSLAGVARRDDVEAGQIGYYDSYPFFADGQSVASSRVLVGAHYEHRGSRGAVFTASPWVTRTNFRARQNFTGDLETSQLNPTLSGLGDLFQTENRETAFGFNSRYHADPWRLGEALEIGVEPGLYFRAGHTEQAKSLLVPDTLEPWDRRLDVGIDLLDLGAYTDMQLRGGKRWWIAGGPRVDLLRISIDDRLAGLLPMSIPSSGGDARTPDIASTRDATGLLAGAHVTAGYEVVPEITLEASYGEGFRSLDAERLQNGSTHPYSRVRSGEAGVRTSIHHGRHVVRLAAFETHVGNELVFEATSGGLETENASIRRGLVASVVTRPTDWLLGSAAFSAISAVFSTRVPGVAHYVPNVPSVLFRTDWNAHHELARVGDTPLTGRIGAGYTLLAGRHLTDTIMGTPSHVVNASVALRYGHVEVSAESYNLLDLRYPDDEQVYVSNWSLRPGQQPASLARHITAAPPRTVLATVAVDF